MHPFLKKFLSSQTLLTGALATWLGFSALAQTPPPQSTGQIGPGTAGTISPAQGVTPAAPDQPHQVLNGALSKQTRQTLWEAMNSVSPTAAVNPGADSVVTIDAGEGAEMNGTSIDKVAFENLPATVKGALAGDVQGTLSDGSGH